MEACIAERDPGFKMRNTQCDDLQLPLERDKEKIGPLIFEFSTFSKKDFEHGHDFVTQLGQFLGALSPGWRYAVELRNRGWLGPEWMARR
jgi:uncharacterized protein YecE (DUF72 family)